MHQNILSYVLPRGLASNLLPVSKVVATVAGLQECYDSVSQYKLGKIIIIAKFYHKRLFFSLIVQTSNMTIKQPVFHIFNMYIFLFVVQMCLSMSSAINLA